MAEPPRPGAGAEDFDGRAPASDAAAERTEVETVSRETPARPLLDTGGATSDRVSRETSPLPHDPAEPVAANDVSPEPTPASAAVVFGDRLPLAERFAEHLCSSGLERGLLGPRELPRIWSRHVLNCAVVAELIEPGASLIDIGSGAGLPGLALAIARPDLVVTLVEPFERRSLWLAEVAVDLDLDVQVLRARAEELVGQTSADVVTARAVAPLKRLLGWGLPLVTGGGQLLAIKGRSAVQELEEARPVLRRLGDPQADMLICGDGVLRPPTTVVRVRVAAGTPARARRSKGGTPRNRDGRAKGDRRQR